MFDIVVSVVGLIACSPVLLLAGAVIKVMEPNQPVLFRQVRIGRDFRSFKIVKFRTMASYGSGAAITAGDDSRVTRTGLILRLSKLDELPQLFNVISGSMSIVGPRPEVPEFVEGFSKVLTVKPGITGLCSVVLKDEQRILGQCCDPIAFYSDQLLSFKIAIDEIYVRNRSVRLDAAVVWDTIASIVKRRQDGELGWPSASAGALGPDSLKLVELCRQLRTKLIEEGLARQCA